MNYENKTRKELEQMLQDLQEKYDASIIFYEKELLRQPDARQSRKIQEKPSDEAEWKFRALFEKGPIGVAYHEMIYDDSGKPVDYLFLEANDLYIELTGTDPRGKTVTQAFPGIENDNFDWIGTYGRVARTGEQMRFEQYLEFNGRWYDCFAYQYKPDHFGVAFLEISDRKKTEDALRVSLTKYRVLFDIFPLGITLSDSNGNIMETNIIAENLLGISREEQEQRKINGVEWKIVRPDGTPMPASEFASVRALYDRRTVENEEMGIVKETGQITWINVTASPIPLEGYGVAIVYNDITAKKQSQQELLRAKEKAEESEEKFKAIADYAASWEAWFNPEGKLVWMNSYSETLTGYTPEEYIAAEDYLSMMIASEDIEMVLEKFQEALRGISGNDMETRINRKDGSKFWASVSWRPILDLNGRSLGFRTSAQDISQRKKAEQSLRESEEKHRILFMDSPDAYLIIIDGVFVDCNRATEVMLRGDRIRIIGQTPDALSPEFQPDGRKSTESALQKINDSLRTGKNSFEWVHQRFDGCYFTVEVSIASMVMGVKPALFIAWRDISNRKQAEKEIKSNHEKLLELNAEKDKFFSIIAHDLRGPFNGFLGLTNLMAEEGPDLKQDEIQRIARNIRDSATNLFGLLENLLEWARLQRGITPFEPASTLLMPLLAESMNPVTDSANKKEIEITYEIPGDLEIFADEFMLSSTIRNLASNAVKFTKKGGKVTIAAKTLPGYSVEIAVRDTGIGMNSKMLDDLFRLDVQTNRRGTENEPSSGLGLIICKDFIEKHGGKLRVESKEGKGSVFYFTIPGSHKANPSI
ncbi:MAG: PAS domain S-box protein [Bacteroidota bacterium]